MILSILNLRKVSLQQILFHVGNHFLLVLIDDLGVTLGVLLCQLENVDGLLKLAPPVQSPCQVDLGLYGPGIELNRRSTVFDGLIVTF